MLPRPTINYDDLKLEADELAELESSLQQIYLQRSHDHYSSRAVREVMAVKPATLELNYEDSCAKSTSTRPKTRSTVPKTSSATGHQGRHMTHLLTGQTRSRNISSLASTT